MPMPMAAMTNSAANTRGTRNVELAAIMRYPMPWFDATVSDITDPTKARVIAILSDAKKYGSERGNPTR